ncbi:cell division protein ZapB [bacterium]|nr:cell division protein ZapB [bacterium]
MELQSIDDLERQVNKLLERHRSIKNERDELGERVSRLEAEVAELKRSNKELKDETEAALKNRRDPEKEQRIKSKVDELLSRLEDI